MAMSNGVTGGNFATLADLQASKVRVDTKVSLNGIDYTINSVNFGDGLAVNSLFANPVIGTTTSLINSTLPANTGDVRETNGFTTSGDGGGAKWKFTGVTGQTPSQTPAQLADGLLNDANGGQWSLIGDLYKTTCFGAIGDGASDDTESLQAFFNLLKRTGQKGVAGAYTFNITNSLIIFDGTKGVFFDGKGCVFNRGANFTSGALRIHNTNNSNFSNFTIEYNYNLYTSGTVALSVMNCSDSTFKKITTKNAGTVGQWYISGVNEITMENTHVEECKDYNSQISSIQMQGAKYSGFNKCSAFNNNQSGGTSGTGVYFKVPIENCYHDNCYAEDCVSAFTVGTSFPTVYGKNLQFTNCRFNNCSVGFRVAEAEDCTVNGLTGSISSTPIAGLGDGVRFESGARRNTINNLSVSNVADFRGAVRYFADTTSNHTEITGFQNPLTNARVAEFFTTATLNSVIINRGFSAVSNDVGFNNSVTNSYVVRGEIPSESIDIVGTTLTINNYSSEYLLIDTENNAASGTLETITTGYNGRVISMSINSDNRDITINNSGNLIVEGGSVTLDREADTITLIYSTRKNKWLQTSFTNNQNN